MNRTHEVAGSIPVSSTNHHRTNSRDVVIRQSATGSNRRPISGGSGGAGAPRLRSRRASERSEARPVRSRSAPPIATRRNLEMPVIRQSATGSNRRARLGGPRGARCRPAPGSRRASERSEARPARSRSAPPIAAKSNSRCASADLRLDRTATDLGGHSPTCSTGPALPGGSRA